MKALYLLLMFSTSSIIGLYYSHTLKERELTIKELNNFFKYLVIKISSKSGTLLSFIQSYKAGASINSFLIALADKLESHCPCPFEEAAHELYSMNDEDLGYVKSISLGLLDYSGQLKALENAIRYFDEQQKEQCSNFKKRRLISYSGIFAGLAFIIIFI